MAVDLALKEDFVKWAGYKLSCGVYYVKDGSFCHLSIAIARFLEVSLMDLPLYLADANKSLNLLNAPYPVDYRADPLYHSRFLVPLIQDIIAYRLAKGSI